MRDLTPKEKAAAAAEHPFADLSDDELLEYADDNAEHLSELDGQIGSEVAMFGDSYPGSADQLSSCRESLASVEREIARRGLRDARPAIPISSQSASILRHFCVKCRGVRYIPGEKAGNLHDCPRALDGCNPADPSPACPECHGKGYIAPPVPCDVCNCDEEVPF